MSHRNTTVVLHPRSAKSECNWTQWMEYLLKKKETIDLASMDVFFKTGVAHVVASPTNDLPVANVDPVGPQLTAAQANSLAAKRKESQWTRYDATVAKNADTMEVYYGVLWATLSQESKNKVVTAGGDDFEAVESLHDTIRMFGWLRSSHLQNANFFGAENAAYSHQDLNRTLSNLTQGDYSVAEYANFFRKQYELNVQAGCSVLTADIQTAMFVYGLHERFEPMRASQKEKGMNGDPLAFAHTIPVAQQRAEAYQEHHIDTTSDSVRHTMKMTVQNGRTDRTAGKGNSARKISNRDNISKFAAWKKSDVGKAKIAGYVCKICGILGHMGEDCPDQQAVADTLAISCQECEDFFLKMREEDQNESDEEPEFHRAFVVMPIVEDNDSMPELDSDETETEDEGFSFGVTARHDRRNETRAIMQTFDDLQTLHCSEEEKTHIFMMTHNVHYAARHRQSIRENFIDKIFDNFQLPQENIDIYSHSLRTIGGL